MNKTPTHQLTENQKRQQAELEAAGNNESVPVDPNAGGSDADSDTAKAAAPQSAGTPTGPAPRTGATTTSATTPRT